MANFLNNVAEYFDKTIGTIQSYIDGLQVRERIALLILMIFLVITMIGSLLWFPYHAALKQQQRLTDLKELINWMQTNAVQLSTQSAETLSNSEKIQRIAQQQGLSIQSQENQGKIQLITTHQNYAVLANFLTQLTQQGLSIESLQLQKQESGEIKLNMTLL